jgi:putative SOS response-associated peptidase YedK
MCGRFAITSTPQAAKLFLGYGGQPNFPPRYNIAPSQPVPIIRLERDASGGADRRFILARWGLLPGFVKDPKGFPLVFNARSETLLQKASFKHAIKRRRCLFFADVFYEWRPGNKITPAQPYLIRRHDEAPMAFAGLWEAWVGPNGEEMDTACIVTTAANGKTVAIHHRLPAILEPKSFDLWLDIETERVDDALRLLRPPENDVLDFFEIGPAINKAANDSPEVQELAVHSEKPLLAQPAPLRQAPTKASKQIVPEQGSLF